MNIRPVLSIERMARSMNESFRCAATGLPYTTNASDVLALGSEVANVNVGRLGALRPALSRWVPEAVQAVLFSGAALLGQLDSSDLTQILVASLVMAALSVALTRGSLSSHVFLPILISVSTSLAGGIALARSYESELGSPIFLPILVFGLSMSIARPLQSLRGADFVGSEFDDLTFKSIVWDSCRAKRSRFLNCAFEHVSFSRSDFRQAIFQSCSFSQCTFVDCDLRNSVFQRCRFSEINVDDSTEGQTVVVDGERRVAFDLASY